MSASLQIRTCFEIAYESILTVYKKGKATPFHSGIVSFYGDSVEEVSRHFLQNYGKTFRIVSVSEVR